MTTSGGGNMVTSGGEHENAWFNAYYFARIFTIISINCHTPYIETINVIAQLQVATIKILQLDSSNYHLTIVFFKGKFSTALNAENLLTLALKPEKRSS